MNGSISPASESQKSQSTANFGIARDVHLSSKSLNLKRIRTVTRTQSRVEQSLETKEHWTFIKSSHDFELERGVLGFWG